MGEILDSLPEIAGLVHTDLVRGLNDPESGREGMMSAEQVFKAMHVKQMNGFSYEDLAFHLEDSRTYRSFCGFGIGDEIPSASTLQRDIKRVTPETLEAVNMILLQTAADKGIEKGRKVRIDCTVVESNIHRPTDSSQLEDSVRVLTRLTGRAVEVFGLGIHFVNHHRRAKKRALKILNAKSDKQRKKPYKDLLQVTGWTVGYAKSAVEALHFVFGIGVKEAAESSAAELCRYISLAEKVMNQTERRVLQGETVPAKEKVVSIFEPHTDIIVKDRRDTYYGHKIVLTGGVSGLFTDLVVLDGNPADSTLPVDMIARQKKIYGRVPLKAAYDGGFASNTNLEDIKEMGVRDATFRRKRGLKISDMAKSTWVYKRMCDFRAGIEGMISFLKRCFGLRRCTWSGFQSFKSYAWSSVITANLLLMARHMLT
jgi:IS5 family transposase